MAWTRCLTCGSLTEPVGVWMTIWSVSPDWAAKDFCKRLSARVDSVPGSVNESVYLSPAA